MEICHLDGPEPRQWTSGAVTVGNFDGVHLGHQALVAAVVAEARQSHGATAVLTFDPHPSRILSPDRAPSALMTLDQKAEALRDLGIDRVAVLRFSAALAQKSAEEFARDVVQRALGARAVVVGANFRFGRHRSGDVALLGELGRQLGFVVRGLPPVLHEGAAVSSTRIREALARGEVESARAMLGRPYSVEGRVVRGEGRGRGLGVPTANLSPHNETLPGNGVYACHVSIDSGQPARPAVVNIGRQPTFGGSQTTLEAHLLGFEGDLYGKSLRVAFQSRLREERRFPSAEELVAQILSDIAEAKGVLVSP
ncbi:MAG TPA: bifunctional riboflavin kinase/FAD synthetase [Vicinamibacteria bacterium]|nr:bifunctional riboflavin kinase/FAD synthetase [Vicinamibacteria bacterium]